MLSQYELKVLEASIRSYQSEGDAAALAQLVLKLSDGDKHVNPKHRKNELLVLTALISDEMKRKAGSASFINIVETLNTYLCLHDPGAECPPRSLDFEASTDWVKFVSTPGEKKQLDVLAQIYFQRLRFREEQLVLV